MVLASGVAILMLMVLYRPLLFATVQPETAQARGVAVRWVDLLFLLVLAVAVEAGALAIGALLSFSLMMGPASTAVHLTHHPGRALAGAVLMAWFTVWLALVLAYDTGLPVGFFVAVISALIYGGARCFAALRDAVLERRWRSA
ncbi:metal ABC transporter permease [Alicyclobacillus contaminans]|uniref:metal ABC transporter permease n=1 Tax=Alicyclobacillus contaminans TaxID=392016 RepID=UPI001FE10947|nr:metal ABC transporter permease [Alicyclobacillus contaminans]